MSRKVQHESSLPAQSESSPSLAEDALQRVLDATAGCIAKLGVDKVSMDDIAAASGLSRATLYRRFGSRDAVLTALLQQQARPFVEEVMRLSAPARSFAERIELSTVHAVIESTRHISLRQIFGQGVSHATLETVRPVYRELVYVSLVPALESARETGELRPGLDLDEVVEWLLSNFLLLVADAPWEQERLLKRVRQFVLPVLVADQLTSTADGRPAPAIAPVSLQSLDQRLSELQHGLGLIRLEMAEQRRSINPRLSGPDAPLVSSPTSLSP